MLLKTQNGYVCVCVCVCDLCLTNEMEFWKTLYIRKRIRNNATRSKHSYFILNIYFSNQRSTCGFQKRNIEFTLNGIFKTVKMN